ncbi:MAG: PD40 domain-containing protein [Armatimonadetes bacterium]|nr:PD40 domain-containing protein [Armatimonadota bacterium]
MLSLLAALAMAATPELSTETGPLLLQNPTMSADAIAFQFAGDLWSVSRKGGRAVRLTSSAGIETDPYYSPDGSQIAFTGNYDGNVDVYVMPSEGGVPVRLTAHPGADECLGWTPDGKNVLVSSSMLSNTDYPRMFTVPATGGMPTELPFPSGYAGSFSPDGKQIAYTPTGHWELAWKRYRGGQTAPVWIGDLADSRVTEVPRQNTDDINPMWAGDDVYYLSDPTGPRGMWKYNTKTKQRTVVIPGEGYDIKSASSGPGGIVYEKFGSLNIYDFATKKSSTVTVRLTSDFQQVRPQFKKLSGQLDSVALSPTGARVAVTGRGFVATVPAEKGSPDLLGDDVTGPHRQGAVWSPDAKTIAYLTDEDGTQKLALYNIATRQHKLVKLGEDPGNFDNLLFSPDSARLSYTDEKHNIWILDASTGASTKVDTGNYRQGTDYQPRWSPDSRWLTYYRDLISHVNAVFVYNLETKRATQVTDGLADATNPSFDRDGKLLYFLASTTAGPGGDFEDMSQYLNVNPVSRVYAVVLAADGANPLQPESDDEPAATTKPAEPPKKSEEAKAATTKVDIEGIGRRIIALPLPSANYRQLESGPEGTFFLVNSGLRSGPGEPGGPSTITKFTLKDRKATPFASGVMGISVSADGKKALLQQGRGVTIVATAPPTATEPKPVNIDAAEAKVDPVAEWRHMFHEVWQQERVLFYDPKLHGIDSVAMERKYEPFLAGIRSRDDLDYLFTDMLGELCIGHMFIGGGDMPETPKVKGGLLGADYTFENGRYRLARVYDGEQWNPDLYAPLSQPAVNAKKGEYILAVDGKDLTAVNDIYLALENKAGTQVKVKIGPNPDGTGSRTVTVVPTADESTLRNRAWSEDNRRYVEKMTGGKGGYVHVPDTSPPGWVEFNRYYFAQADKTGMVVDERFNHGGLINDYMVDWLTKPLDFGSLTRHGKNWLIPPLAVYGPKVMLINEMSGSGGDIFPFLFRQRKAGQLVGRRTWGAMLSAYGFGLADGGSVRAPDDAMYNPVTGQWIIENEGTPPDIDVPLDPYQWRLGHDSQLDKAIEILNAELAQFKLVIKRPAYPDKSKLPPR